MEVYCIILVSSGSGFRENDGGWKAFRPHPPHRVRGGARSPVLRKLHLIVPVDEMHPVSLIDARSGKFKILRDEGSRLESSTSDKVDIKSRGESDSPRTLRSASLKARFTTSCPVDRSCFHSPIFSPSSFLKPAWHGRCVDGEVCGCIAIRRRYHTMSLRFCAKLPIGLRRWLLTNSDHSRDRAFLPPVYLVAAVSTGEPEL
jgi:hypothetical protein